MIIDEKPLFGRFQLETSVWGTTFTWIDRTSTIAGEIFYAEGGRVGTAGQSQTDVGTLTVTFKDAATIPLVGDLVRLRRFGTSEYWFTGYVQDVTQRIVFDSEVSYTTPVTLTTISCADWVGYLSQFQVIGVGGHDGTNYHTSSTYPEYERVYALNRIVDPTGATQIIQVFASGGSPYNLGDTDFVGTMTEHLDLIRRSNINTNWWGTHNLPTNKTTGRTSLVRLERTATPTASGYTFQDIAGGTSSELHYTDIDFENSSQNVANNIIINNRARLHVNTADVTRIGGYNESAYMVINNQNVVGVPVDTRIQATDATSITTYGNRVAEFDTNINVTPAQTDSYNLVTNPNVEYSDLGYSTNTNARIRRRKPSLDPNPFSAVYGDWAIRHRQFVSATSSRIVYTGTETDGIPVTPGKTYYFEAYAARGTTSQTNTRAYLRIEFYNDAENIQTTNDNTRINLTNANQWYYLSFSAVAPTDANRAIIYIFFDRTSGSIQSGDRLWCDGLAFSAADLGYSDGDTIPTFAGTYLFGWTGAKGDSPSYRATNFPSGGASAILGKYSTTSMRASRLRFNAQENLAAVSSLTVGKSVVVKHNGTTGTYQIVGINGSIQYSRYMIDYYLQKI